MVEEDGGTTLGGMVHSSAGLCFGLVVAFFIQIGVLLHFIAYGEPRFANIVPAVWLQPNDPSSGETDNTLICINSEHLNLVFRALES
jgi:hypothetical protein